MKIKGPGKHNKILYPNVIHTVIVIEYISLKSSLEQTLYHWHVWHTGMKT